MSIYTIVNNFERERIKIYINSNAASDKRTVLALLLFRRGGEDTGTTAAAGGGIAIRTGGALLGGPLQRLVPSFVEFIRQISGVGFVASFW